MHVRRWNVRLFRRIKESILVTHDHPQGNTTTTMRRHLAPIPANLRIATYSSPILRAKSDGVSCIRVDFSSECGHAWHAQSAAMFIIHSTLLSDDRSRFHDYNMSGICMLTLWGSLWSCKIHVRSITLHCGHTPMHGDLRHDSDKAEV